MILKDEKIEIDLILSAYQDLVQLIVDNRLSDKDKLIEAIGPLKTSVLSPENYNPEKALLEIETQLRTARSLLKIQKDRKSVV